MSQIRITKIDLYAIFFIFICASFVFRYHLFGDHLWIGNPDRLNGDLKYLKHYIFSSDGFSISAWDEFEMMGWDSFAMVGLYPNPLVYIVALFGKNNIYYTMGFLTVLMLATSSVFTYAFLRIDFEAGIAPIIGAVCYELSTLTLLKASQNSMSFAVFITIPLLAILIRLTNYSSRSFIFFALFILLSLMLNLMFLQKVAYALMLIGAYSIWRSFVVRSWLPCMIFGLSLFIAFLFSFPRILGIVETLGEYSRIVEGLNLKNFQTHYKFHNIYPAEFLRWFDYSIFGRTMSEGVAQGANLNLTEGVLFYTSAIVPFLLISGVLHKRQHLPNLLNSNKSDVTFFFWTIVFCFLVIICKPFSYVIFVLFNRMDFMHSRILIAALLPLSYLVVFSLVKLFGTNNLNDTKLRFLIAGFLAGLLIALLINTVSESFSTVFIKFNLLPAMRASAIWNIGLSGLIFFILLFLLRRLKATSFRCFASSLISGVILTQCLIGANSQINGVHVFNESKPFNFGDFYYSSKEEFRLPSDDQLNLLHERIQPNLFRVALVCDQLIAGGFCAGHVPEFWQLRTIDGYYGLGVPKRLRALPWPSGASMRSIGFLNINEIPWDLLGYLNVNAALIASADVFLNVKKTNATKSNEPFEKFEIVDSPARVTPRVFFAASIEKVENYEESIKKIFRTTGISDPTQVSFVEKTPTNRAFSETGSISLKSSGDLIELRFDAATSERFLVLNELYYPGWYAEIDNIELPILATNAVMRGVLVPPGATKLNFHYVTRSMTHNSWQIRIISILVFFGFFFLIRSYRK